MKNHKFLLIIIILVAILQLLPIYKLPKIGNDKMDLIENNKDKIPQEIQNILKQSCYDCHSNNNRLPWYSYIAPVKWIVNYDIIKGREELNFSQWEMLDNMDKIEMLDEINEAINENEMPLKIYTFMHKDAVLTQKNIDSIEDWSDAFAETFIQ